MKWFKREASSEAGAPAPAHATPRQAIDAALATVLVTDLRARGFIGSLPHFRRRESSRISLLSVQHFSSGGRFVVEIATCGPDGVVSAAGAEVPPNKVTAQMINVDRPRLGSDAFPDGDHWFVYGPAGYEPGGDQVEPQRHYEDVAHQVRALLDIQAEPFWQRDLQTENA